MEKVYKHIAEGIAAGHISKQAALELVKLLKHNEKKPAGDIAVIGVAVNLPKAGNVTEYWNVIKNGIDCIDELPKGRQKDIDNYLYGVRKAEYEIKYYEGAFLEELDKFDYKFFKMTPKQASLMDPNHRLMLEVMWTAIEDAGYGGDKLRGSNTGVYVGFANPSIECYANAVYDVDPEAMQVAMTGNIAAILPSRISYMLDLKGPSILLDTACSSSLVAVHMACQGIERGDCDLAIAGGIKLHIFPLDDEGRKIGIESSDSRTKTFDDRSDGTGVGEGTAAVVLKQLSRALKDGDPIYAVIKGSAVNQDGASIGITAPNPDAQADVIVKAWEKAQVHPETITYIEAHGTGTKIGDPIEIDGITKAFRRYTDKRQFCAIGTVKTNIGHLYEGSGIAGFIKLVLSLKEKKIPPTVHFKKPSSKIDFEDSPVYVNNRLVDWETDGFPRRAGISAFGFSGTNCHIILEEAPPMESAPKDEETPRVLTLSAKSRPQLNKLIRDYIAFVDSKEDIPLRDICFTTNTGRGHYEYRLAVICKDIPEMKAKLVKAGDEGQEELNEWGILYGEHKIGNGKGSLSEADKMEMSLRATGIIDNIKAEMGDRQANLEELCRLYVQGADVTWDKLYENEKARRVNIPTYPFERTRCWLDLPEVSVRIKEAPDSKEGRLHYHICWKEEDICPESEDEKKGAVLLFKDEIGLGENVAEKLRQQGRKVVEVSLGTRFEKSDEYKYTTGINLENLRSLVKEAFKEDITHVLHLCAYMGGKEPSGWEEQENCQKRGVYSLFYFIKALSELGRDSKLKILLVSDYANEVTGTEEVIIPDSATVFGFGKSIGRENEYLLCRGIDIDSSTGAEEIISELGAEFKTFQCAYRNGKRYVEEFDGLDVEKLEDNGVRIRDNGVYLITGGTGGIGLAVANYLASKEKVKLALINRSKIPDREQWEEILLKNEDSSLCSKIKALKKIEYKGAQVSCYSADVSDLDEMKAVTKDIREKFGCINGVFHGAGVPAERVIAFKDEDEFNRVYSPKVKGTRVLDMVTQDDQLDFFIMCSSVAAIFTMAGQADYSAANNFMDSYAAYRKRKGKNTLTVDWVAWRETGMAVNVGANVDTMFIAITTDNAIKALDEVISRKVNRLLIGEINYESKLVNMMDKHGYARIAGRILANIYKGGIITQNNKRQVKSSGPVTLTGREDGNYTETEKLVGQIWGNVFGYAEMGIRDSFYDLGGDSILAVKIINKINGSLNAGIEIADIMNYLTIEELAGYMDRKIAENSGTDHDDKTLPGIEKVEEAEFYPVSSAQKRMLLMSELKDTGTSYNISEARVLGKLDSEKLEKALKEMVKRHDACRTSFGFRDGNYVQFIHEEAEYDLTFVESDYMKDQMPDIDKLMEEFVRPFDLGKAPLFRVRAVLGEEKSVILTDFHHIIWDAFSKDIFMNEFFSLYEGKELPEQKLQYKDYTVWQNNRINAGLLDSQEKYWMNRLSGTLPVLELPTDFTRPAQRSFKGSQVRFSLGIELIDKIHALCQQTGTTLFMVLFSAYNILLNKYSGQDDIIVGTPTSGRVHSDTENIIGLFVNTLALRNRVPVKATYIDFLMSLREDTLKAFDNQEYPFEELVEKLDIPGIPGRNPLFDTVFVLQNIPITADSLYPIQQVENKTSKFDLVMEAIGGKDYMYFTLEYCTDLFKKDTVKRMGDDYIKLLDTITGNKEIIIEDIELENRFSKIESTIQESVEFDF